MTEKDSGLALGVFLFKIWLVEKNEFGNDSEYLHKMTEDLAMLSRKGIALGATFPPTALYSSFP